MLIGFDYATLHPSVEKSVGNLVLLRSIFGWCVGGTHPTIKEEGSLIVDGSSINFLKAQTMENFFKSEALDGKNCKENIQGALCSKQ